MENYKKKKLEIMRSEFGIQKDHKSSKLCHVRAGKGLKDFFCVSKLKLKYFEILLTHNNMIIYFLQEFSFGLYLTLRTEFTPYCRCFLPFIYTSMGHITLYYNYLFMYLSPLLYFSSSRSETVSYLSFFFTNTQLQVQTAEYHVSTSEISSP